MSTREKIRELLDEGLTPKEIADKVGCKVNTVYTYRHMFKKEEEPASKDPAEKEEKPKEQVTVRESNKLERENKALKAELIAVKKEAKEREVHREKLETIIGNQEQMIQKERKLAQNAIRKFTEIEKENIELKKVDVVEMTRDYNELKSKYGSLKKHHDETKAYSKHVNEELYQLQEESKRKDTEITLYKQESQWAKKEYNESEKRVLGLQVRNDELRAEAQKMIDRLQAELDAERAKHEHLSSYTRILMKKEGVANA